MYGQGTFRRGLLGLLCAVSITGSAWAQRVVQSYYVPFREDDVHLALNTIDDFDGNIGGVLRSTISIVAGVTNTVMYWDHWEDGYEGSILAPTQSSTEVWGDLNPSNGIPPGYSVDQVNAGDIITLKNDIAVPRDPATVTYDGRDKFSVTRWVAVSRAMHAVDPGEVLAGSAQMYDKGEFGFRFRAPVGVNVGTNQMFEYATMLVQAGHRSTVVNVDADNDGVFEETVFLNEGETHEVRGVSLGATISASKPVQCHMITGDIGSNYEMRWLTLFPSRSWDDSYFTAVGKEGGVPTEIYLFNPNTNTINVSYETFSSTGVITVASDAVETYNMPSGSGGHFFTTNGLRFIPVAATDARSSSSHNQAYDWGHGMVSDKTLTSMTLVPWGPGIGGSSLYDNGNPVWVTAVSNTTLYVDYDGDPGTGPLTDPDGRKYDFATNVTAMETVKIYDNSDNDQTGIRVYSLDDTHFTTAWGQDADTASPGNPYLDMGSAILPFPTVPAVKEGALYIDLNTNGVANPGDSLKFTIYVENIGFSDAKDVIVHDSGASNTTYTLGSTTLNTTNISDDVVPPALTAYPLDEDGYNIGDLAIGATAVVEYVVQINDPFPTNVDGVVNGVFVEEDTQVFIPVPVYGFDISKTSTPTNPVYPGDTISYQILVTATASVSQAGIRVTDNLPADMYWVTNSTRVSVPGRFEGSVRDEFNTDEEFYGTDGPLYWSADWQEINESDGAGAGDIQVTTDSGAPGSVYMLRIQNANQGAYRVVDLGQFTNGILSFKYRRESLESSSEYVTVDASSNGGSSWTELGRFVGAGTDAQYLSTNYDITAYLATNTAIRFRASGAMSSGDRVWIDDVDIAVQGVGVTNAGGAPPILLDEYTIDSNDTLLVTFDAGIKDSITVSQVLNTAYVTSFGSPEPLGSSATNIVILPPRSDITGQVRFDADADGDLADSDAGIAGVNLSLFSDPNGDGDPSDGVILETANTDTNGDYTFSQYLADDYVILETDPANHISTADRDGGNLNLIEVTTTSGVVSVNNDFLDTTVADISGQVRNDSDGDGNINDPDVGIAGVTVQLYTDPNGDGDKSDGVLWGTDFTDGSGNYSFNTINSGTYVLVESDLPGYVSTGDSDGTNDGKVALTMPGGVDSTNTVFLDAASGLSITKSSQPGSVWYPDLEVTYTITVVNTGVVSHTGVSVTDTHSAGVTYVSNTTRVVADTSSTNTLRDEFGVVSYGNNDGTENWAGNWVESDSQGGGAGGGVVRITGGELRITDGVSGTPKIKREADLTDYTAATLTFDYRTSSGVDSTDEIDLQVSTNGSSWTTLHTFAGQVSGSASYDLFDYISPSTYIRFKVGALYGGANEYFYVDDLQILGTEVSTINTNGGAPPTLISGYGLAPGGTITITFTGVVGSVNGVTNQACVDSDQLSIQVCDTIVNTARSNATPDRISGQVRNDLDGDGDLNDPESGLQGVTLTLFSDPNGDGDPSDGSSLGTTLTDSAGYYIFGQLTNGDYVVEEADPSGYQSTADSQGANDNRIAVTLAGGSDAVDRDFLDVSISGLEVTKTIDDSTGALDAGETVVYTIVVTNTRTITQAGIDVTDVMPTGLIYEANSTRIFSDASPVSDTWYDQFNAVAFTNSDGTQVWSTDWTETGDSVGPSAGDLRVVNDQGSKRLRVRDDNNTIYRTANLSGRDTATLEFDYRRQGLEAGEYVAVDVRSNSAASWVELDRFANDGSGSTSDGSYKFTNYTITAYISDQTGIRFRTPPGGMANGDIVYFDNVKITASSGGEINEDGNPPPYLVSDFSLGGGGILQITYTASVGFVDEVINEVCVTVPGDTNGICTAITNGVALVSATQGLAGVQGADSVLLAWTAISDQGEVIKEYDALWVDRNLGFTPSITDEWAKAVTVTNSFFIDKGGVGRPSPFNMGNNMRFYRAARQDAWTLGKPTRIASRQVYVAKCINLEPGENWVSLMMIPDSNCVAHVLGTNTLPAGTTLADSTRIEWYGADAGGAATNVIWLSSSGVWLHDQGGGVADHDALPLNEGFNIVLPPGATSTGLLVVGQVPTNASAANGSVHTIKGAGKYNVVSYNVPYRVQLKDSGLREAGFTGAPTGYAVNPNNSDELRILARGGGSLASPKARILMDQNGQFVFWSGGSGSAENYSLDVDDALIVYTRRSSNDFTWNVTLPYPIPTTTISP